MTEILQQTKNDIKFALEEHGINVDCGLVGYGDKIRSIQNENQGFPFSQKNLKFGYSNVLTEITEFDSTGYTDMSNMFRGCGNLTTVPLMECGDVKSTQGMFKECRLLHNVGGFKDLGKQPDFNADDMFYNTYDNVNNFGLSRESVRNIVNNLYDRASAGLPPVNIFFYCDGGIFQWDLDELEQKGWTYDNPYIQ